MINWKEHIISDRNILLGKPTIKGTRLSIEHLVNLFAVFAYVQECLQDGLMYELPKSA